MRAPFRAAAAFLVAAAMTTTAAGCGGTTDAPPAGTTPTQETTTAPDTTAPDTSAPDTTGPDATTGGSPARRSWPMPDLRGRVLQDAQDAMQSLTHDPLFLTRSHDVTGRGRHQILDRDWQVCTQNVAPGAAVTLRSQVDFGVVRVRSEQCP